MFKKIIMVLVFSVAFTVSANASWYILNKDTNRAVSKIKYAPDEKDLASRNEVAVFSKVDIPLEDAELFKGKIQKRAKSQEEKNEEKDKKDKKNKKDADFESAKAKLIALGLTSDEVLALK